MKLNQFAHYIPSGVKAWIPEWLKQKVRGNEMDQRLQLFMPTTIPPDLPDGESFDSMFALLSSVQLDGVDPEIMNGYLDEAFLRFIHTLALVPEEPGELLELGANPYFMTTLLEKFKRAELTLGNYYETEQNKFASQIQIDRNSNRIERKYHNFNIEQEPFPFETDSFDYVLFCEILEHLTTDPLHTLMEIKRVLKPEGCLILTTPNVARLENVARLGSGHNIYDPYSGYGPYGRHNREYTLDELTDWLIDLGFKVDKAYTSDVRPHNFGNYKSNLKIWRQRTSQKEKMGQYCFVRAINIEEIKNERPQWLFRAFD